MTTKEKLSALFLIITCADLDMELARVQAEESIASEIPEQLAGKEEELLMTQVL